MEYFVQVGVSYGLCEIYSHNNDSFFVNFREINAIVVFSR